MVYRNLEVAEERRDDTGAPPVKDAATKHDVTEGGILGAVGGAVVGALAGGPVGAVVGAILGGVASATAVEAVDQHDHDAAATHGPRTVAPEVSALTQSIRERAYALYEQRGRGDGLDVQDWLAAEHELTPS